MSEYSNSDIDLGFAEERESAWLTNRYFPSKIGGFPAWLDLNALPTKEELICSKCKSPKAFLCQIYAPYEDEYNFHRSIYIFICRTPTCQELNSSSNLTVLRSQLPRINDFYSQEPPKEDGEPLPEISPKKKLCLACGCPGPLTCSRCKKACYCSTQHQKAHWSHHKKICSTDLGKADMTIVALPGIVFPEYEIVMEPNDSGSPKSNKSAEKNVKDDSERMAEYEKFVAEGKTGDLKDIEESELDKYVQSSESVHDKYFRKFKKEVSKDPEQILRYKRNGEPLWIADVTTTFGNAVSELPNCEACGEVRQFEFQIMPQMLLQLKDEHLDWGVLAIYTCKNSCIPKSDNCYHKEYIVKQDIVENKS